MAVYEPGKPFPRLSALHDAAELARWGVLAPRRGKRGRGPVERFRYRWDKNPEWEGAAADGDSDDELGEDADGVWTTRHPEALLAEDPALAEIVSEFWSVSERGITKEDYATRDAFWLALWSSMLSARSRDEVSRLKGLRSDGKEKRRGKKEADDLDHRRPQGQARRRGDQGSDL